MAYVVRACGAITYDGYIASTASPVEVAPGMVLRLTLPAFCQDAN